MRQRPCESKGFSVCTVPELVQGRVKEADTDGLVNANSQFRTHGLYHVLGAVRRNRVCGFESRQYIH